MKLASVSLMFAWGTAAAASPLTPAQQSLLHGMIENDLTAYLDGGKSLYHADWAAVALPWTEDKDIGMRYMRGAVAADAFYGHRVIFVRGRFIGAENWVGGAYRVQLWALAAIVNKADAAFLNGAHNGSTIEMACHAQGQELQFAYVNDCIAADDAIAALATARMNAISASEKKNDATIAMIARWADGKIARDDPCRQASDECAGKIAELTAETARAAQ